MASHTKSLFVNTDDRDSRDDDDISLTSTVEEGGDYDVEELLAERENPDHPGQLQFLIKWEGYPLDQCTWEPLEHLGEGVYEGWEETKAEIQAGKRNPFDMQTYHDVVYKASLAKMERHMRRNAKRKRLGFPLTQPLPLESPAAASVGSIEGSDKGAEAAQATEADPDGTLRSSSPRPSPRLSPKLVAQTHQPDPAPLTSSSPKSDAQPPLAGTIKQKMFQGIPSPKPGNQSPVEPRRPSGIPATGPSHDSTSRPRPSTGSTITGYKGTARPPISRKSSMNSAATSPTSASNRTHTPIVRKFSGSEPSSSATTLPKPSSSLRAKFSGKKATRTRTERQAIPNVFSSGKVRQPRKSLKDTMMDSSKDPKQFSNMRIQNIARKRGNEMNDAAPPSISSIPAAFILTGDQTRQKGQQDNQTAVSANSPVVQSPPLASGAGSPSASDGAAPAKRPKKSVRFSGTDDVYDIPVEAADDFDPVLSERLGSPPALPESPTAATARKKMSLANYQGRCSVQTVVKPCSFGKDGSGVIQVKFSNIPRQTQEWLSAFQHEELLQFRLICSSDDFMYQRGFLCEEMFASGSLDTGSEESMPALGNVAERMRRRSIGLYMARPEYSVLVYPTECEGWKGVAGDQTEQVTTNLGYLIFKSPIDAGQYPDSVGDLNDTSVDDSKTTMEKLVKLMMDLDFSALSVPGSSKPDTPVFMLMFPPQDTQLLRVITLWLRSCEPKCRIFSSEVDGSFVKFIECTKRIPATIILHEEVVTRIRRIPLIWQMVDSGQYTFFSLATGRRTPPRFPSRLDIDLKPNQHALTQLFPAGRAFFVTPSFVISDPVGFYEFVHWFSYWCKNPRYLIAASADFLPWLKSLCMEKGEELKKHQQSHRGEAGLDPYVYKRGLGKERTDAMAKGYVLLHKIMSDYGDEGTHFSVRRIMWAPRQIDPNDEQSLVNWYLWWSTMFLDQHRRFYVLGSNARYKDRAYRTVRVPNYDPDQTLDPDELREKNRLKGEAEEKEILNYWDSQSPGIGSGMATQPDNRQSANFATRAAPLRGPRSAISPIEPEFPTALFRSDRAVELQGWLRGLDHDAKSSWATPFFQPVSWENLQMADHFSDPSCEYANYNHWLSSCSEFWRRANTWVGLFYTPNGDWDPKKPASAYTRHPWIAAFRPVNPHYPKETYGATELFIWDLAADEAGNLSDMQMRLVEFVKREAARLVSPKYYLEKVWFSNDLGPNLNPQDHPLDVTCLHLREMTLDCKTWLPPWEALLRDRGWKQLPLSYVAKRMSGEVAPEPATTAGQAAADDQHAPGHRQPFPKHPSDEGEPPAFVWLPPRGAGSGAGPARRFRCYNGLYEAAYGARAQHAACREFRFHFRPTGEWYDQQRREGRGCSHVCVDAGDRILEALPKTKGDRKQK